MNDAQEPCVSSPVRLVVARPSAPYAGERNARALEDGRAPGRERA